jgi:hypothetical protein
MIPLDHATLADMTAATNLFPQTFPSWASGSLSASSILPNGKIFTMPDTMSNKTDTFNLSLSQSDTIFDGFLQTYGSSDYIYPQM